MDPIFFVLAWLAYVAVFWLIVFWFDRDQCAAAALRSNPKGEILTVSLRPRP